MATKGPSGPVATVQPKRLRRACSAPDGAPATSSQGEPVGGKGGSGASGAPETA